ncbi:MAG: 1,2-phenylacetyl-CoA epoxidase subunit PaaD [Jatrophihabitantaceae bacterium]
MAEALRHAREAASAVPDPELPMLTLAELGILRGVAFDGSRLSVSLTPTYSGCPAMREMQLDVRRRLVDAGYDDVQVSTVLSPPWSSDWITEEGRRKLADAGIAPPLPAARAPAGPVPLTLRPTRRDVRCPHCGSPDTEQSARFGATACRALYRCSECAEPFEYLKEI